MSLTGAATGTIFVATKIYLSQQNVCRDKIMFIATNICRKKHNSVATSKLLSRQNFVAIKMILVAAPANDKYATLPRETEVH